ncbi:hypothetical protein MAR_001995 [Mya arenaria]|uniref:Uncharacterized protein n=1 Tax=Mya arenaria TaxID=6604 RepID=A0ABY7FGK6_MYAAR|nr:hypothetical protein MAR_001995 [Mya arenaria]
MENLPVPITKQTCRQGFTTPLQSLSPSRP